jgi:hypothetical protein
MLDLELLVRVRPVTIDALRLRACGGIVTMPPWVFDEPGLVGLIALVLLLEMAIARDNSIGRVHLAMFVSIEVFPCAGLRRF